MRFPISNLKYIPAIFLVLFAPACSSGRRPVSSNSMEVRGDFPEIRRAMKRIEPFFSPMGSPEPNDWLQSYREPGQTFDEYLDSNPTLPTSERRTIYVLPLGKFTAGQARAITI